MRVDLIEYNAHLQDLRGGPNVIIRSGTLPSFLFFVFFALRTKKRKTAKTGSTMLPQAKRHLRE
jgi:hypothetical protein